MPLSEPRERAIAHLRKANEIRSQRARLKREIAAGRSKPAAVLVDPPPYAEAMRVRDVLLACPTYGRVKSAKLMKRCRISFSAAIGNLTARQRRELVEALGVVPERARPTSRELAA
jgi:hypothetical protein